MPTPRAFSAINLKEIVVTFNGAVDKTTAETAANYTVKVGAASKTVTAKVNADLKSVTLTLATEFTNQDAFDVTVENVKNTTAAVITKTTLSGVAFDTVLPTAVSANVTGPTTVEVTFSEPIKTAGTYKLNNGTYYVSANVADGTNKVTLNVASLPEGNYTLNVADAVDFANFKSVSKDLTFTFAKDTAASTVTLDSISQTKAVIKFNEPITTNAGKVSHSVNLSPGVVPPQDSTNYNETRSHQSGRVSCVCATHGD